MFTAKEISQVQQVNTLQPKQLRKQLEAVICNHCFYVNEHTYSYCTNCGRPLKTLLKTDAYKQRLQYNNYLLFRAETAVTAARVVLYVMAIFLSMGILFIFAEGDRKYLLVLMAVLLSGLFFSLAFWSRKNPFSALLTAFIVLIAFCAVNIFRSLTTSFTTLAGFTGMFICIALLAVVLKGVQGAYRINLIRQQMQINI